MLWQKRCSRFSLKWQEGIIAESFARIQKGENIGEPGDIEFKKEELDESKKMTPDMKYIKWPGNVTVMKELMSVVVASAVLAMLIAAGDQLGMAIVNLVLKFI